MKRKATKRPKGSTKADEKVLEINLESVQEILKRTQEVLTPEEQKQLEAVVASVFEVLKIARDRGSGMARIRRLFGLHSSEKTKNVEERVGHNSGEDTPPASDKSSAPDQDPPSESSTGTSGQAGENSVSAQTEDDPRKKKKGHGRNPAEAYINAKTVRIPHEHLIGGGPCPLCPGRLHEKDPSPTIRLKAVGLIKADRFDSDKLRCGSCGKVFIAELPEEAKGPKYPPSVSAMVGMLHYSYGLPFNRLEAMQENLGTPLPSSTQWEIVRDAVPELWPVFEHLRQKAAQDPLFVSDDSNARILEFMGNRRDKLEQAGHLNRPDRTGLYSTAVVTEDHENRRIAVFWTGRNHAGENMDELLDLRAHGLSLPAHVSDALKHNSPKNHEVDWGKCNAHSRRNFVYEAENYPKEVLHVLVLYGKVFKNEKDVQAKGLPAQERLEYHKKHSGPVMAELRKWVDAKIEGKFAEPNSDFGKALAYIQNHWKELTLFLKRPGVPITSNAAERALKKIIRYRNNSLFYRSIRGAMVADLYTSLIYTAELNKVNVFEYLVQVQSHPIEVALNPEDWMPWNYQRTMVCLHELEESKAA